MSIYIIGALVASGLVFSLWDEPDGFLDYLCQTIGCIIVVLLWPVTLGLMAASFIREYDETKKANLKPEDKEYD